MEAIKEAIKSDRLPIRQSLLDATLDSIKASIKLDDLELAEVQRLAAAAAAAAAAAKRRSTRHKSIKDRKQRFVLGKEDEEKDKDAVALHQQAQLQQRTYRALPDRRFAFMVVGDQQQLAGKYGKDNVERMIFPEAPPLDYSFCLMSTINEIITEQEPPQTRRNFVEPRKTHDDRYITSSLRLSYNVLRNIEGMVNILYKILETGPIGLCWLDLSFNSVDSIDEDVLTQLPNLCILYLHANQIEDMLEIRKLIVLPSLHTLTVHGNPVEQDQAYRMTIVFYMPHLKHLDFVAVTKGDKAQAAEFGSTVTNRVHWDKKHKDLAVRAEEMTESANMSLTERYMLEGDDGAELFKEAAF